MKSICIKLTNQNTAKYLLEQLDNFELDSIYFSYKKFKIYYNVIIHYKGKNIDLFCKNLAKILSFTIIDLYEENIIKNLIKSEYFYFDSLERQQIANTTYEDLYEVEESVYKPEKRFELIYQTLYNYLNSNHSIVLKGFITFRLKAYFEAILEQIDKIKTNKPSEILQALVSLTSYLTFINKEDPDNFEERINALTDGEGVDVVMEVVGSNQAICNAVAAAGPNSTIVLVGNPKAENVQKKEEPKSIKRAGEPKTKKPREEKIDSLASLMADLSADSEEENVMSDKYWLFNKSSSILIIFLF